MAENSVFQERPAFAGPGSAPGSTGDDNKDVPGMREDVYAPGERPALAGLLPGMPGESSGNHDNKDVPWLREELLVPIDRPALAQLLPGMSGKAET